MADQNLVPPVAGEPVFDQSFLLPEGFRAIDEAKKSEPSQLSRGFGAGLAGLQANIPGGFTELVGERFRVPGLRYFGAGQRAAGEAAGAALPPPSDLPGVIEEPSKALPLSAFSAGNLLASYASTLGSGGLLAAASKLVTGRFRPVASLATGAGIVSASNEIGETFNLAREAGADNAQARAIAGGVPAALLDFAALAAPAALLLGKKVGPLPLRIMAALVGAPVFESATEAAQDAVKGIAATGRAPGKDELANTFFTTLLGAVPTLGVPGGIAVAARGRAAPAGEAPAPRPAADSVQAPPQQPTALPLEAADVPLDIASPPDAFGTATLPESELEYTRSYLPGEAIQFLEDKDLPFYQPRTPERGGRVPTPGVPGTPPATPGAIPAAGIRPTRRTKGGLVAPVELDADGRPFKQPGPIFSPYDADAINTAIKGGQLSEDDVRRAIQNENFGDMQAVRRKAGLVLSFDEIKASELSTIFNRPKLEIVDEPRLPREKVVARNETEIKELRKQSQSRFVSDQITALGLKPATGKTLSTALSNILNTADTVDAELRDQYIAEGFAATLKGKMPKEDQQRIIESYFAERSLETPEHVSDVRDFELASVAFSPRGRAINDITNILAASGRPIDGKNVATITREYLAGLPKDERAALHGDPKFLGELKLEIKRQTGPNRMLFSKGPRGPITRSFNFLSWFGNSVVVNPDGSPKVVYHGTLAKNGEFDVFQTKKSELGAHFGTAEQANSAVNVGPALLQGSELKPRVIPVFLRIENPLRLRDFGIFETTGVAEQLAELGIPTPNFTALLAGTDEGTAIAAIQRDIQDAGYDGIVYLNRRENIPQEVQGTDDESTDQQFQSANPTAADSYIVFDPEQVKSAAGNIGAFSAQDPSILRQQGAVQGLQPGQKIVFSHWGNVPTGRTDPQKMGTGVRGRDNTDNIHDQIGVRYTSAVLEGAAYTEPEVTQRQRYVGTLDPQRVYDARNLRNDPKFIEAQNDVRREFGPDFSAAVARFQKMIRMEGFDAALYANGQLRIFTEQQVWPAPTAETVQANAKQAFKNHQKTRWGATNLVSGVDLRGTPGFWIGLRFGGRRDFKTGMNEEMLTTYARENQDQFMNPGNVLHTWYDRNDGETVAAVGTVLPDLQSALKAARESGQLTVVDLRTGMEIPVSHPVFDIAHTYNAKAGLAPITVIPYTKAHPEMGRAIALAYDELEVRSNDPDTVASYEAFAREIEAQFEHALSSGIRIEPWPREGQPYANSAEMRRDVFENRHLWVYARDAEHPFLTNEQNIKFRAIHDLFGHAKTGFEFGPNGEWNATRAHAQMFSDKAVPAMFTETTGQNSWVNFGRQNEGLPLAQRAFAQQKADLLPRNMIREALYEPDQARTTAVENLDAVLTEKGAAAVSEVHRLVGHPLDLDVLAVGDVKEVVGNQPGSDRLTAGTTGVFLPRSVSRAKALIALSYHATDALSAAGHEGFHYIDTHVLASSERAVLDRALKRGGDLWNRVMTQAVIVDEKNDTDVAAEIEGNPYEARAYAFQYWRTGSLNVEGPVTKVFAAIRRFLERISNFIDGLGFTSYEDLFTAIERGAYARSGATSVNRGVLGPLYAKSSAEYPGAPGWLDSPNGLRALRQRIARLALEGEKYGRYWYEESSRGILNFMNGDRAQATQFAKLLSVFSSRTNVPQNFNYALKAWTQWQAGRPIKAGRSPTEMSATATAIMNGTYISNEFGHEVPGEKRNNFFKNMMIEIDPAVYGPQVQGPTIDMWMSHIAGYGHSVGTIGRNQYKFLSEQVRTVAQRMNWPIHQVQAAIWTAIKARMEATRPAARPWGIKKGYLVPKLSSGTLVDESGNVVPKGRQAYEYRDKEAEVEYTRGWMQMAMRTAITEAHLANAGYNFSNAIADTHRGESGALFSKGATEATGAFPQEHEPMLQGVESLFVNGEEDMAAVDRGLRRGDAQHAQITNRVLEEYRKSEIPDATMKQLFLHPTTSMKGTGDSIVRFVERNVMSLLKLSERSKGVANVAGVLFAHGDRKKRLIADSVEKNLSEWVDNSSDADGEAVSAALMARTVGTFNPRTNSYDPILEGSPRWISLRDSLGTEKRRRMFDQANNMVGRMLLEEFRADQRVYREALGPGRAYTEWEERRRAQIAELIRSGYIPERRFGDFTVHGFIESDDKTRMTVFYSQFETQRAAQEALSHVQKELGAKFPEVKFEWGTKNKIHYDGSVSYLQFVDTARRLGISLTQAERERLARFTIEADSMRRNRVFRRLNVPGFSKAGERILAEFAVGIANKVAHSEFNSAISDALHGFRVDVQYTPEGAPITNTTRDVNMWRKDGPLAGHYRNLMEERANYVLNSQHDRSDWSSRLRSAASMHFLGGSVAAMMVQLTSLPMFTVPWLFQYTGLGESYSKVASGFKVAVANFRTLTDLTKLQDRRVNPVPEVDAIPGLRDALVMAARDGTILDTELYQIMGMARGSIYSKSKGVQTAIKTWMAPFRSGEHINRLSTFIAAYRIGQNLHQRGKLPTNTVFDFAKNATLRTQFRYDEANRPGLAHSNLGALLFVFRSFPLYALEMITTLHKQSPKAAAFALFSLWVAAGTEGLPFAANILDLIDVISQRLFGSSFNARRVIRNVAKDASEAVVGADMSGLVTHGMVNYFTGMQFASRVGLGEIIPGTRFGAADTDYKRFMSSVLGPIGNMVESAAGGVGEMTRGEFKQGLKTALPIGARNLIKGFDYWTKGYAEDRGGRKLIDVNGFEAAAQSIGFSSAALAEAYNNDRIIRQDLAFYNQVRGDLMREVIGSIREGRADDVKAVFENLAQWNRMNPDMPIILNASSVRRQVLLAGLPLNQRTLLMLPRQLRTEANQEILGLGSQ